MHKCLIKIIFITFYLHVDRDGDIYLYLLFYYKVCVCLSYYFFNQSSLHWWTLLINVEFIFGHFNVFFKGLMILILNCDFYIFMCYNILPRSI